MVVRVGEGGEKEHLQEFVRIELIAKSDKAKAAALHENDVRHLAPAQQEVDGASLICFRRDLMPPISQTDAGCRCRGCALGTLDGAGCLAF